MGTEYMTKWSITMPGSVVVESKPLFKKILSQKVWVQVQVSEVSFTWSIRQIGIDIFHATMTYKKKKQLSWFRLE